MPLRFQNPIPSIVDDAGLPVAGGKIEFYIAGTDTPKNVYLDRALTISAGSIIILDSVGRIGDADGDPAEIYLDTDVFYKLKIYDADDVLIRTIDNFGPEEATLTIVDYGADPTGASDDDTAFDNAGLSGRTILVPEGEYNISGTTDLVGTKLLGDGKLESIIINSETVSTTDYGLHLYKNSKIENLTINAQSNAVGNVNGRSNCAILMGSKLSSSDEIANFITIKDVKILYDDAGGEAGNTVAGFGNVSDSIIENLDIVTDAETGLQFHWGFNLAGTRTNHPRRITARNLKILSSDKSSNGLYLSGCHDITTENSLIKDCSIGVVVGAGDVGGARDPQNESVDLICGNLNFNGLTIENCVNDAFLIQGASFVLGSTAFPLNPNKRWVASESRNVGVNITDCRVIREADSANNVAITMEHFRNIRATNFSVGRKSGFQDVDATEALTLKASNDCYVQIISDCVVALNALSGKNNHFDINHTNSDIDNTLSQNGVIIRAEIVEAEIVDAIAINDDEVKIAELTCDIHPGMLFENGGNIFEFEGAARYSSSEPSQNTNVIVAIKPATATISAGATIEQYYCPHSLKISGKIRGMNKGVRITSNDARVPFNIDIDADFEDSVVSDIEVPLGIEIKYKDSYYFNDAGGIMTIKDGVASPNTVIRYKKIGKNKIGFARQVPSTKNWVEGDYLYNDNIDTGGVKGWRCVTSGTPGTWIEEYGTLTIFDFGAIGDGVEDDTDAFVGACASGKTVIIPGDGMEYNIVGTFTMASGTKLDFQNNPTVNLTMNANVNGDRGFWFPGGCSGAKLHGHATIYAENLASASDGSLGVVFCFGKYVYGAAVDATLCSYNEVVGDFTVICPDDMTGKNIKTVGIYGWSFGIRIKGVKQFGSNNFSFVCHWGQNITQEQRDAGVLPTKTWHPDMIIFEDCEANSDWANCNSFTVSAVGLVFFIRCVDKASPEGFNFFCGDLGYTYQQNLGNFPYQRIVCQNIASLKPVNYALSIDMQTNPVGLFEGSTLWTSADKDKGGYVYIDGFDIRLEDADSAINGIAVTGLHTLIMKNVNIIETDNSNQTRVLQFYGCNFVKVESSYINSMQGILLRNSGTVVLEDCIVERFEREPDEDNTGLTIGSRIVPDPEAGDDAEETVTVDGQVDVGDTSITIDDCSLVAGAGGYIYYSGYRIKMLSSSFAGIGTQTIQIEPSPVLIPNNASVTLVVTVDRVIVRGGEFNGWSKHIRATGATNAEVGAVRIIGTMFKYGGVYDIEIGDCLLSTISECTFDHGGQRTTTTDKRSILLGDNCQNPMVVGNTFGKNNTKMRYLVSCDDNASGGLVKDNIFLSYNASASNPACVYKDASNIIIGENVYGEELVRQYPSKKNISEYASSFPTSGDYVQGDIVYNSEYEDGAVTHWICVADSVGGDGGEWSIGDAEIKVNTTLNVPADFATPLDAMNYLMDFKIKAGVTVTIAVSAGTYTHTAPIRNHPQGDRIIIQGATATFPTESDFVITGSSVGARATDNANHLTMLKAKFPVEIYCNNSIAIDFRDGTPCPTMNDLLFYTDNSASAGFYLYAGLMYMNRCAFHGWGSTNVVLTNSGQLRVEGLSSTGSGLYGVQVSDHSSFKSISGAITCSNTSVGFLGKRNPGCEAFGIVSKGNGADGVRIEDGGGVLEMAGGCVIKQNAESGVKTANGGEVSVNSGSITDNGQYGINCDTGKVIANAATVTGNTLGGVVATAGGHVLIPSGDISLNVGFGARAQGNSRIDLGGANVEDNGTVGVWAEYGARIYAISAIVEDNGSHGIFADTGSFIAANSAQSIDNAVHGVYANNYSHIDFTSGKSGESGKPNGSTGIFCENFATVSAKSSNIQYNTSRGIYVVEGNVDAENATIANNVGNELRIDGRGFIRVLGVTGLVAGDISGYWETLSGYVYANSVGAYNLFAGAPTTLTIASGVVTATGATHLIDTEGAGATDDLDTISGGAYGQFLVIRAANSARTVVVKHGTGNIQLDGSADKTLDNAGDTLLLHNISGTTWYQVAFSNNGA